MYTLDQQFVFAGSSLLCAAAASVQDARRHRIPNSVTAPAIACGLVLHAFLGRWSGIGDAVLAGLAAGTIALLFWLVGGMGGGDVKLLAAIGSIAGCAALPALLVAVAVSAALVAAAVSLYHGRLRQAMANAGVLLEHHARHGIRPHPDLNLDNPAALRVPFALPAAAGCLFWLSSVAWEVRR